MLPKNLTRGLIDPKLKPEELQLNNFIQPTEEELAEEADSVVESIAKGKGQAVSNSSQGLPSPGLPSLDPNGLPRPLTEEEAKAVDRKVEQLLGEVRSTRRQIASIRDTIDRKLDGSHNAEGVYRVDISNKPMLRRAIKKVFGVKVDTITYPMYKAALDALKSLEASEAKDYVDGVPFKKPKKAKDRK